VALDVLDVVELGSERVFHVDDNDLPIGLLLIKESHDTENLDLLDLTGFRDEFADLAYVEWVIVSLGLGLGVNDVRVLPSLSNIRIPSSPSSEVGGVTIPEGRRRSSRGSLCGGSSCGHSEACPS